MNGAGSPAGVAEWATTSGDIWAERWRDTDAALETLSPCLLSAIAAAVPNGPLRAFDIGCGPGSTTLAVAEAVPEATIVACDISPSLAAIARDRTADKPMIEVFAGDAVAVAEREGPFDLLFSRHGVMFFADPVRAFRSFRSAAKPGASLVFSCFRTWDCNPWAAEVAAAAAGRGVPPPGREPSGFAFAEPDYVHHILSSSGWSEAEPKSADFSYVAGDGIDAVRNALTFLAALGPASRVLQTLTEEERLPAIERMRSVIKHHFDGMVVEFPAAAWVWRATAGV